jgi:indole-3-glycerol phosphate synthase
MKTILDEINNHKKTEVRQLRHIQPLPALKRSLSDRQTEVRDFSAAIRQPERLSIIAEIKKASPSQGVLRKNFDPVAIARLYDSSSLVDAISVLTDRKYFHGDIAYIRQVKSVTSVPVLRKDFIIDEYQIYESFLAEADAILLIVASLSDRKLKRYLSIAHDLGLSCVVEVHTEEEVGRAIGTGARIIGINARNLKTFSEDPLLFQRLRVSIPETITCVAESGLKTRKDLEEVFHHGANAVLVGTALMKSDNIQDALIQLVSERRLP